MGWIGAGGRPMNGAKLVRDGVMHHQNGAEVGSVREVLLEGMAERLRCLREAYERLASETALVRAEIKPEVSDARWSDAAAKAIRKFFVAEWRDRADDDMIAAVLFPEALPHAGRKRVQKIRERL